MVPTRSQVKRRRMFFIDFFINNVILENDGMWDLANPGGIFNAELIESSLFRGCGNTAATGRVKQRTKVTCFSCLSDRTYSVNYVGDGATNPIGCVVVPQKDGVCWIYAPDLRSLCF